MKFETKAIRLQMERSKEMEHSAAIYPTSSFIFHNAEEMQKVFAGEQEANIYSRFTNPSVNEFEKKMASLEGVERAQATASGMAAVFSSILPFLKQGDHLIASKAVFGSSFQVLATMLPDYGIETTFVQANDPESWREALRENSKMFFLESPSNPGLEVIDLNSVSQFCKEYELLFNVDNCMATPYLQQPASFGADLITHSATKFIDGQGRVLGGVVCGSKELIEKVYLFIRKTGASLSPFNAWILSKSLETLAVRMDRHCENASKVAQYLLGHPKVSNVNYPFLESHAQFKIAKKQMKLGGGLVTFEIQGGLEGGRTFLNRLKLFSLTANLGDCRSIASHPASTTHRKLPEEQKAELGITSGLVRLSVGLEHIDDIIEDIDQALLEL